MGLTALCGLRGCKNRHAPFLAECHKRWLNQVLSVVYLSMCYCIVVYYGSFLCIVSFRWHVFCLLVVLVELSALAKWGSLTMARGSSPQSPGQRMFMLFLVYCIVSLFNCTICFSCPLTLRDIFLTPMTRCSLFVLKVSLDTDQLTN